MDVNNEINRLKNAYNMVIKNKGNIRGDTFITLKYCLEQDIENLSNNDKPDNIVFCRQLLWLELTNNPNARAKKIIADINNILSTNTNVLPPLKPAGGTNQDAGSSSTLVRTIRNQSMQSKNSQQTNNIANPTPKASTNHTSTPPVVPATSTNRTPRTVTNPTSTTSTNSASRNYKKTTLSEAEINRLDKYPDNDGCLRNYYELQRACANGNYPLAKYIIEQNLINTKNREKTRYTILHFLFEKGDLNTLEYLLKNGIIKINNNIESLETLNNLTPFYLSCASERSISENPLIFFQKKGMIKRCLEKQLEIRTELPINSIDVLDLLLRNGLSEINNLKNFENPLVIKTNNMEVFKRLNKLGFNVIYFTDKSIFYSLHNGEEALKVALYTDNRTPPVSRWCTFDTDKKGKVRRFYYENSANPKNRKIINSFLSSLTPKKQNTADSIFGYLHYYNIGTRKENEVSIILPKIGIKTTQTDINNVKNQIEQDIKNGIFDKTYVVNCSSFPIDGHFVVMMVGVYKKDNGEIDKSIHVINTGKRMDVKDYNLLSEGNYTVVENHNIQQNKGAENCSLAATAATRFRLNALAHLEKNKDYKRILKYLARLRNKFLDINYHVINGKVQQDNAELWKEYYKSEGIEGESVKIAEKINKYTSEKVNKYKKFQLRQSSSIGGR